MNLITFTTDFGTRDWFVGTMKGVVLGINSRARVVDITHEIPSGDIRAGAFALAASCSFFPKGTIHVAVVDPGVGSTRKGIAVKTRNYVFVGPDNGVLSLAIGKHEIEAIHSLENETYFLKPVSTTFHGRDIFSPVAAHLSRGVQLQKFGPRQSDFVELKWSAPRRLKNGISGEVVYIDKFGNSITNIRGEILGRSPNRVCQVLGKKVIRCPLVDFYQAVPPGKPAAIISSSGFLEIAVNGGSAEKQLGLRLGIRVVVLSSPT